MTVGYRKPGVTVKISSERIQPSLTPGDEVILIIGESTIFPETFADQVKLTGSDSTILTREGIDDGTLNIVKRSAPSTALVLNTDYDMVQTTALDGMISTAISKKFTTVTSEGSILRSDGITNNLAHENIKTGSVTVKNSQNSGSALTVTGATNANPIVITTSANHGLSSGDVVTIASVGGNTNANGTQKVTVLTATTFSIPVTGNAAYTSGGTVQKLAAGTTTFVEGVDYYIDYSEGRITHIDGGAINTFPTTVFIGYQWSTLSNDDVLIATYDYTPSDLNEIKEWTNINQIIDYYGPSFSGDSIYSPISLAASLMGVAAVGSDLPTIKTLAVGPDEATGGNTAVIAADDYAAALQNIVSTQKDITHIVVLSADTSVWSALTDFVENQENDFSIYERVFTGAADGMQILARATGSTSLFGLGSKRVEIVCNETVPYTNPSTGNEVQLPGYYAAAQLVAMEAIRPKYVSLTNKIMPSFNALKGNQLLTESQKDRLAASGGIVLENENNRLKIRHAVTTSLSNPENQEPSVVRTLDFLARDFITAYGQTLSDGDFFADDITKETFRASTEQRLSIHATSGIITDWDSVEVDTNPDDSRRFIVQGRINPRFPLNGVDFDFTIP